MCCDHHYDSSFLTTVVRSGSRMDPRLRQCDPDTLEPRHGRSQKELCRRLRPRAGYRSSAFSRGTRPGIRFGERYRCSSRVLLLMAAPYRACARSRLAEFPDSCCKIREALVEFCEIHTLLPITGNGCSV